MHYMTLKKSIMIITNHAYERAKERLGWTQKVLEKMSSKALSEGIRHSDTKGRLNKYITATYFSYKTANNIRIYGENVYLFDKDVLITVYQLPNNLRSHGNITQKNRIR